MAMWTEEDEAGLAREEAWVDTAERYAQAKYLVSLDDLCDESDYDFGIDPFVFIDAIADKRSLDSVWDLAGVWALPPVRAQQAEREVQQLRTEWSNQS